MLMHGSGTLVSEETSDNYQKYHRTYFRDRYLTMTMTTTMAVALTVTVTVIQ